MRVLIADTYYPAFLDAHYQQNGGLAGRPYEEQLSSLLSRFFGTGDAYSRYLREHGHQAVDAIVNCRPLQQRWLAENRRFQDLRSRLGMPRSTRGIERLLQRAAGAQIREFDPRVVYMQDLSFFPPPELRRLRDQGRLVVGQIASQAPEPHILRGFNLLITSFPHFVERFRALGIDSEYLKIAFHEDVLECLRQQGIDSSPEVSRAHRVSFVGGLDPRSHGSGVELLEGLAREVPLEVWGYDASRLQPDSPLLDRYHGQVWGLDMYRVLAESQIVVNRHIDVAEGHANNMRLFESTGVGALLITESADNLADMFEPGREVVTYDGPGDLIEKVRYYLEHEQERREIAAAGQDRTLSEHTYRRRIGELAGMLEGRVADHGR